MSKASGSATPAKMGAVAASLVQSAIDGGLPGAALGIVNRAGEKFTFYSGDAQVFPESRPLKANYYFDLASLTKVLFTLPQVMRLLEEGLADLEDPLRRFLPEASWLQDSPLPRLTLRQLLSHQSGLPAWEPIYTWGADAATLKARLLQQRWRLGEPVYSDIGFMLLGMVLERLRDRPLSRFELPAGLSFAPDAKLSVATENCPWRGRVLVGEVHDCNAFALGGVAGHAGLFGTLEGVLDRALAWLNETELAPASHAAVLEPQSPERLLGWVRRHHGWSGGGLTSAGSYGHTGFTGTGVWVDPERGYAWALLTNRVHPSRHGKNPIPELRRSVANAIAASWRPQ